MTFAAHTAANLIHPVLADQPPDLAEGALDRYPRRGRVDEPLARAFAGVEVIRRRLGVAQLPLSCDLTAKRGLIDRARDQLRGDRG